MIVCPSQWTGVPSRSYPRLVPSAAYDWLQTPLVTLTRIAGWKIDEQMNVILVGLFTSLPCQADQLFLDSQFFCLSACVTVVLVPVIIWKIAHLIALVSVIIYSHCSWSWLCFFCVIFTFCLVFITWPRLYQKITLVTLAIFSELHAAHIYLTRIYLVNSPYRLQTYTMLLV